MIKMKMTASTRPRRSMGGFAAPLVSFIFAFILAMLLRAEAQQAGSGSEVFLSLEHAVGGAGTPFSPRGQLTLPPPPAAGGLGSIHSRQPRLAQPSLSDADLRALKELAAKGGRYQVRVRLPNTRDARRQVDYVTATVPACALLASNLEDDLRLTLDQLGNVVGIDYRTATADCSAQASGNLRSTFNTQVRLGLGAEAAKPIRQEIETPEQLKEKAESEKGFFAKYWMYIVPFVLIMLFSSFAAPEPEGGAAAGGDAGARGAPARRGRR